MAIVRVQTGTAATTTGTGTITPTLPAGATAGNIIIALIAVNTPTTAPTISSSGGATKQVEDATGNAAGTAIFAKVAAGGETNIGAFPISTGTRDMYGILLEYSGLSGITAERTQHGGSAAFVTVVPTGVTASSSTAPSLVLGIEVLINAAQTATVARAAGDTSTGGTVTKLGEAASTNATNAQKITSRVSEVITTGSGVVGHTATVGTARSWSASIASFRQSAGGATVTGAATLAAAGALTAVGTATGGAATVLGAAVLAATSTLTASAGASGASKVPNTDTLGLTNDGTANWGNSPDRVPWWNSYKGRWDAILPMAAPPAAGQSDWWIVADVMALTPTAKVLVDTRSGSRPTTVWDSTNKRLYAVMEAVGGQGGSLIWAFDYNDTADTYTVVSTINGVSVGINGMGGDSNTGFCRTPNGYLWVASSRGGAGIVVNRSTDNGATWGTPATLLATQADGKLAVNYFTNAGTTYVCIANGENGIAAVPGPAVYHFLRLDSTSAGWATAGNWTNETSSIPAFTSARIAADDETCLARDASENLYWITETENLGTATSADEQWLLFKRTPSGTWSKTAIHNYDGTPSRKRPTVTIDTTNSEIYVFANTDSDTNIVYRKASLSNLAALSSASDTTLFSSPGKGHRNTHPPEQVTGGSDLLVLCDQQTDDYAVRNLLPIAAGVTQVAGAAVLASTGLLTADAKATDHASATLAATGVLTAVPKRTARVAAILASTSTAVVPTSKLTRKGVAVLAATSTLTAVATGKKTVTATAVLPAVGTAVVPAWKRTAKVTAVLPSVGSLVAVGNVVGHNVVFGSATLASTGTLTALGKRIAYRTATLSATSAAFVPSTKLGRKGQALLPATGTLTAQGGLVGKISGTAVLSSTSTAVVIGKATRRFTALLPSTSTLVVIGKRKSKATALLPAVSTLTAQGGTVFIPPPAYQMPSYRMDIFDLNHTLIRSDILCVDFSPDLSYSYALNGPGAITWQLPTRKSGVTPANYLVGQRTIELYRNDILVWAGWLMEADGDRDWVTFSGRGWYEGLRRRLIDTNQHFYQVEAHDIAWQLIAYTQAKTSLGITRGSSTPSGQLRSRDFCCDDFTLVSEGIEDLAGMVNGFDFWVTPQKVWNVQSPRRGVDRTATVVFNAQTNIVDLSYSLSTEDMATEVFYVGPNPDECRDLDSTAANIATYGRQELGVDMTNMKNIVERDDYAAELLRYQSVPLTQAQVRVPTELGIAPGAFDLGDRTTLQSADGWLTFNQTMRVIDYTVHATLDSVEEMNVTLDSVYT